MFAEVNFNEIFSFHKDQFLKSGSSLLISINLLETETEARAIIFNNNSKNRNVI